MGEVYLAEDTELDREVALSSFSPFSQRMMPPGFGLHLKRKPQPRATPKRSPG